MTMEDMPLTEEDKIRLRNCLDKNANINTILKETIKKHTLQLAGIIKLNKNASPKELLTDISSCYLQISDKNMSNL